MSAYSSERNGIEYMARKLVKDYTRWHLVIDTQKINA